jgi:hypothetical protein
MAAQAADAACPCACRLSLTRKDPAAPNLVETQFGAQVADPHPLAGKRTSATYAEVKSLGRRAERPFTTFSSSETLPGREALEQRHHATVRLLSVSALPTKMGSARY